MATLAELRQIHKDIIQVGYTYPALLQQIVDDTEEPQAQRSELAEYIIKCRTNVAQAAVIVDILMMLKTQGGD